MAEPACTTVPVTYLSTSKRSVACLIWFASARKGTRPACRIRSNTSTLSRGQRPRHAVSQARTREPGERLS